LGGSILSEVGIDCLKKGNKLTSYYWSRFGPYPLPVFTLRFIAKEGDSVRVQDKDGKIVLVNSKFFAERARFITVK